VDLALEIRTLLDCSQTFCDRPSSTPHIELLANANN
jgi:hypothetical protein